MRRVPLKKRGEMYTNNIAQNFTKSEKMVTILLCRKIHEPKCNGKFGRVERSKWNKKIIEFKSGRVIEFVKTLV